MGFFDFLKKIITPSDTAAAPGEYTPATYNGLERSYHYTDVVVRVVWRHVRKILCQRRDASRANTGTSA